MNKIYHLCSILLRNPQSNCRAAWFSRERSRDQNRFQRRLFYLFYRCCSRYAELCSRKQQRYSERFTAAVSGKSIDLRSQSGPGTRARFFTCTQTKSPLSRYHHLTLMHRRRQFASNQRIANEDKRIGYHFTIRSFRPCNRGFKQGGSSQRLTYLTALGAPAQ